MAKKPRKLASIQVVHDVQPIENADSLEVASILGWKVVVRKGEFKKYDKCVYCEVDSIMPEKPEFEFLRPRKHRIKTVKLRGQLSQGIAFPLSILPEGAPTERGDDVTAVLGVTKFEPVIPACLSGEALGSFPDGVPKTDEIRVQSEPDVLDELRGKAYYITVKVDGSSGTFANLNGQTHVCSRNLSLRDSEKNTFWRMFRKYKVDEIFDKVGPMAIQGEVAGPSIQKNPLGLKDHDFFVFNVYCPTLGRYYDFCELKDFCERFDLEMVPIDEEGVDFQYSMDELLEKARGKYPSGKRREGIVIRPQIEMRSEALCGRLSFKAINNDYLLKDED